MFRAPSPDGFTALTFITLWNKKAWTKTHFKEQFNAEPHFNIFCNHLAERHGRRLLYRDSQSGDFLLTPCRSFENKPPMAFSLSVLLKFEGLWAFSYLLLSDEFFLLEPCLKDTAEPLHLLFLHHLMAQAITSKEDNSDIRRDLGPYLECR